MKDKCKIKNLPISLKKRANDPSQKPVFNARKSPFAWRGCVKTWIFHSKHHGKTFHPPLHLGQNLDKFVLITKKFRQIPVISWPPQVLPTCLNANKNLSTETNLQRCRRPASEHDFLRTTNKNCFSSDKPASQFSETYLFFPLHILTCQARA